MLLQLVWYSKNERKQECVRWRGASHCSHLTLVTMTFCDRCRAQAPDFMHLMPRLHTPACFVPANVTANRQPITRACLRSVRCCCYQVLC